MPLTPPVFPVLGRELLFRVLFLFVSFHAPSEAKEKKKKHVVCLISFLSGSKASVETLMYPSLDGKGTEACISVFVFPD